MNSKKIDVIGHSEQSLEEAYIENCSAFGTDYLKWKTWGENFGVLKKTEAAYIAAEISRTKRKYPENSKILEIGFGNGKFLKYAQNENWSISGTEVNEALVRAARQGGFNVFHSDNLSSFEDNSFDLIVAFDVLEHIPQEDLPRIISEVKRVLKVDGHFIARFPNGDSPFGLINQNSDVTHITTIGSGKARYLAAKTDMDVVFLGGEAQPLIGTSLLYFMHAMIALPIKILINTFVNLIFFPRANLAFCSPNLTIILKARKNKSEN